MTASSGERTIVVLGMLPLLAAAIWLIVLREPTTAVAHVTQAPPRARSEASGLGLEPSFVGVIVAGQDAELGAELSGEVVRAFRETGAHVRKGEPLLQLAALSVVGTRNMATAQQQEDRAAILAAKLAHENAQDQLDRMINAPSAYAARDVQKARADAARAEAELERLRGTAAVHKASLQREIARSDKQMVRAPFDGVLSARFLDVGDFASPGQVLARVVDDTRFVRFALPAAEHARLRTESSVRVVPTGSDLPIAAKIVDVDPELDPAAGLGFARARLADTRDEPDAGPQFAPGSRVEVFLSETSTTP